MSTGPLAALIEIEADTTAANDHEKILLFQNTVGSILEDVMTLVSARTPGVLEIDDIEFAVNEDILTDDQAVEYVAGQISIHTNGLVFSP